MRTALSLCVVLCIVMVSFASAQEDTIERGIDRTDLQRREVETVGGENLWSYMLFMIAGLGTVYFTFRGNKRA